MPMKFVLGDRKRFVWTLSILLTGAFLATSLISYKVAHDSVSEQIAENALPLTSDNIYSEIQRDLLRPIFISSLMARDTFLRDWVLDGEQDQQDLIRYLKEIQEQYGTVSSFFVSEQTHKYYHPNGVLKTVSEDDPQDSWYFRTRQLPAGEEYEVNIDADTADTSSTTVFVNYRVYDYAGRLIGVTGVGLAANMVKRLIEAYQQRYGRRVFFIDRQGEVTLRGRNDTGSSNIRAMPGLDKIATQLLTSPGGSFSYERNGRTVYLNSRLVPEFKWYLVVEQEESPAEEQLLNTLFGNLLLSLLVTVAVLFLANLTIGGYQRRLEQMAVTDKLTGTSSRQVFETLYEQTLRRADRDGLPVSVVMLDIDEFKSVNDRHGHLAGDRVIKTVADMARDHIRDSDAICRWGGEEFVLLLKDCDLDNATELAERIRRTIEHRRIAAGNDAISVTCSLGVTQYRQGEDPTTCLNRSDQALYEAKEAGRNRVKTSRA
jgi:diguanylate cyclase (GGDEF)-like protein